MKSFQILDKDGKAVSINDLDKEVCEFWSVEYDKKSYAQPIIEGIESFWVQNWYDCIGSAIKYSHSSGWNGVVIYLIDAAMSLSYVDCKNKEVVTLATPEQVKKRYENTLKVSQPYIDLIKHWQSKGYQPKQID